MFFGFLNRGRRAQAAADKEVARAGAAVLADGAFTSYSLLGDARAWVEKMRPRQAVKCPCCGLTNKVYKRALTTSMLRHLFDLYRWATEDIRGSSRWYVLGRAGYGTGDASKLLYWGLAERHGKERDRKYRITTLGVSFVNGARKVPSHVYVFDGECIGHTDELVDIGQALGTKFDYDELMRGGD
jgi:hypothetical protein